MNTENSSAPMPGAADASSARAAWRTRDLVAVSSRRASVTASRASGTLRNAPFGRVSPASSPHAATCQSCRCRMCQKAPTVAQRNSASVYNAP